MTFKNKIERGRGGGGRLEGETTAKSRTAKLTATKERSVSTQPELSQSRLSSS